MTELEKEAEEYADWFWGASPSMMRALANAYIKGAEPREKRIADLERQLSDIVECFQSASSGDDFEMAESAREIMEILDIPCYRHGKVKSKLSEAKEIIKDFLLWENSWHEKTESKYALLKRAEDFIKE